MRLGSARSAPLRTTAIYLLAHALACLVGAPFATLPELRSWSWPARIAVAFALGALVLAVEAMVFTLLGAAWSAPMVLAPSAALALFLARKYRRVPSAASAFRPGATLAAFAAAAGGIIGGHLTLSLATARSTSVDFLFSWGVKAVRFAAARAVDPSLLHWSYFGHGQPFYPPLVPVLDAWGVLAAGHMPWRTASLTTLLWFGAAAVLILEILRHYLGDQEATVVTTFWAVAIGNSLAFSYSGASAEAPLILYVTVAGVLLLTETAEPSATRRLLAGLFLAGAVLTKVEGSVSAGLLVLGTAARDLAWFGRLRMRRLSALALPPLVAGLMWSGFVLHFGVPVGYAGRGAILELQGDHAAAVLASIIRNLYGGTWWLSWGIPLLLLLISANRKRFRQVIPGAVTIIGSFAFFVIVYLHEPRDPSMRISWEIPRISQPALSLLIAMAGILCVRVTRPQTPIVPNAVSSGVACEPRRSQ